MLAIRPQNVKSLLIHYFYSQHLKKAQNFIFIDFFVLQVDLLQFHLSQTRKIDRLESM